MSATTSKKFSIRRNGPGNIFDSQYDSLYKLRMEPLDKRSEEKQKHLKLMNDWKEQVREKEENRLKNKYFVPQRGTNSDNRFTPTRRSQDNDNGFTPRSNDAKSFIYADDLRQNESNQAESNIYENNDNKQDESGEVYNLYNSTPNQGLERQNSSYIRNSGKESLRSHNSGSLQNSTRESGNSIYNCNSYQEPAFADIMRGVNGPKNYQKNPYVVERCPVSDAKDVVDWSRESMCHQTAKKMKLNNTENYKNHNNFLQKQMENENHHFQYKKRNWEQEKLKQYKPHGIKDNEQLQQNRTEIYNTARNEYLQNRVRLGLFANKELNHEGQINFTRFDRNKQMDKSKNSFFANPSMSTEQSEKINHFRKAGDREIHNDYQHFFKKEYERDEDGNFLYNKDFVNSNFRIRDVPREISKMYPISSETLFKSGPVVKKINAKLQDMRKNM